MESKTYNHHEQLHIFFFPYMAQGHMIPVLEMAKLFASRGLKSTLITTTSIASFFAKTLTSESSHINIVTFEFPCSENGFLPIENISTLGPQLDHLLEQHNPHCLVADVFFPWATDIASKYGIPRIVFHGSCFFSISAFQSIYLYAPHKNVSSDSEPFVITNLPGDIQITRDQMPDFQKNDDHEDKEKPFTKLYRVGMEAEMKSYGVLVNSFYELEKDYADYYRKGLGMKAWSIGPLLLYNKFDEEKANRGVMEISTDARKCLKWLSSKKPNSVVYICFGSLTDFTDSQLVEIASSLEACGHDFIWVVKKKKKKKENADGEEEEKWLPKGFEKRMEGKGLIVRGWAPQMVILEHEAVGGFVTHCGWNSILEAVCAGVPMVTWPVAGEQFYNEILVTQILGIGVGVGAKKCVNVVGDNVKKEDIKEALRRLMVGEEAEEMRKRAKEFGKMARRAVREGGSSYSDIDAFIQELKVHCYSR